MKSFMKALSNKYADDPDEPIAAPAAKPTLQAQEQPSGSNKVHDEADGEEGGPESRGQLLQRHKREVLAHKKTVTKLGKANKDTAAKLTQELETRHAKELKALEDREQQKGTEVIDDRFANDLKLEDEDGKEDAKAGKASKAQKRRAKLAKREAEREARIQTEALAEGTSSRQLEEQQLEEVLKPAGLGIHDIQADGNCLYRAVEHQLVMCPGEKSRDYAELRRMAADYIRQQKDSFLPFILDDCDDSSPEEQLEAYCAEIEDTNTWGGQLELGALAQSLKKAILVYTVGLPVIVMGEEHKDHGVLNVCYMRHAYGLGEHYNSLVPRTDEAATTTVERPSSPDEPEP